MKVQTECGHQSFGAVGVAIVIALCMLAPQPATAQRPEAGSAKALFTQLIINRQLGPFSNRAPRR